MILLMLLSCRSAIKRVEVKRLGKAEPNVILGEQDLVLLQKAFKSKKKCTSLASPSYLYASQTGYIYEITICYKNKNKTFRLKGNMLESEGVYYTIDSSSALINKITQQSYN